LLEDSDSLGFAYPREWRACEDTSWRVLQGAYWSSVKDLEISFSYLLLDHCFHKCMNKEIDGLISYFWTCIQILVLNFIIRLSLLDLSFAFMYVYFMWTWFICSR